MLYRFGGRNTDDICRKASFLIPIIITKSIQEETAPIERGGAGVTIVELK